MTHPSPKVSSPLLIYPSEGKRERCQSTDREEGGPRNRRQRPITSGDGEGAVLDPRSVGSIGAGTFSTMQGRGEGLQKEGLQSHRCVGCLTCKKFSKPAQIFFMTGEQSGLRTADPVFLTKLKRGGESRGSRGRRDQRKGLGGRGGAEGKRVFGAHPSLRIGREPPPQLKGESIARTNNDIRRIEEARDSY